MYRWCTNYLCKKEKTIVIFCKIYVKKKNYYRNSAFLLEFSTLTTMETKNYVLKFVSNNYIFDFYHLSQIKLYI